MDFDARQKLRKHLEDITRAEAVDVDQALLKEVKQIVRQSDDNLISGYDILFERLRIDNSQVRLSGAVSLLRLRCTLDL